MDLDRTALVFVYGTLKRRFPNHSLLADLAYAGDASFLTAARTARRFPLVIGPLSIPFLLRLPGSGRRVDGELYSVSSRGLSRLDELEGTTRGHYERLPLVVVPCTPGVDDDEARDAEEGADAPGAVTAEAYFAHPSFGEDLWRRCRERGLRSYTEDDASGYVPPKDRPAGTTFLGEVGVAETIPKQRDVSIVWESNKSSTDFDSPRVVSPVEIVEVRSFSSSECIIEQGNAALDESNQ